MNNPVSDYANATQTREVDMTVGELIDSKIAGHRSHIEALEGRKQEAKNLGIFGVKVNALRYLMNSLNRERGGMMTYKQPEDLAEDLEWHLNNGQFNGSGENLLADICLELLKRIERLEATVFEEEIAATIKAIIDRGEPPF